MAGTLTVSDLKTRYGEYPCPKCPKGFMKKPMKKGQKRKSLRDCKCISVVRVLGISGARRKKIKAFKYCKTRHLTPGV